MEASAGQALVVFKEDPKYDALVPGIEAAFVDATKLAGFVATAFVLLGVLFSLLLPKTQMHKAPDHEPVAVDEGVGERPAGRRWRRGLAKAQKPAKARRSSRPRSDLAGSRRQPSGQPMLRPPSATPTTVAARLGRAAGSSSIG